MSATTTPLARPRKGISLSEWGGRAILILLLLGALWRLGTGLLQNPTLFAQQVVDGFRLGFVYALIALGYTMVYGIVRLINFAHGDVFMVGAFISFYGITRWHLSAIPANLMPGLPKMVNDLLGTLIVLLLSALVCMILAVVIERVAYRPIREAPRINALITAIGVSFFLEYFGALKFAIDKARPQLSSILQGAPPVS